MNLPSFLFSAVIPKSSREKTWQVGIDVNGAHSNEYNR